MNQVDDKVWDQAMYQISGQFLDQVESQAVDKVWGQVLEAVTYER
jgi:hypothetical protein